MCEKHVKPLMTRFTNAKKKHIRTSTYYEMPPNVHNTYYLHVIYVPVDLLCVYAMRTRKKSPNSHNIQGFI